jgi:hypothetical protein
MYPLRALIDNPSGIDPPANAELYGAVPPLI